MSECPPGTHSIFDFCPGNCAEPISAYEVLGSYGLPEGAIEEALMTHAHELAEDQRAYADSRFDLGVNSHWYEGAHDAADLIDPEKL